MTVRVGLLDYGAGNIRSMARALEHVGAEVTLIADGAALRGFDGRLVLPGVGTFRACKAGLWERRMITPLKAAVGAGNPLLGVCVGMQVLADWGYEGGRRRGLGLIPGNVEKLTTKPLPNVGWRLLTGVVPHPLLAGVGIGDAVYVTHSYEFNDFCGLNTLATIERPSRWRLMDTVSMMVARGNVAGVQFHPEKSQAAGLRVLANFLRWNPDA